MDAIRKGMRWSGPLDRSFVAHLAGLDRGRDWSTAAFQDPVQWAIGVLGIACPAGARPCRPATTSSASSATCSASPTPTTAARTDDAAQRIADLTEARRILLAVDDRAPPARRGRRCSSPGPGARRPPQPGGHRGGAGPAARCTGADFPYREEGRRAPDRAPKLLACVVEEAGRSLAEAGGRRRRRSCSAAARWAGACARWPWPTASRPPRLVLIAYPLHPPGQARAACASSTCPQLTVPCLFISGTKDPFGTPGRARGATPRRSPARSPTCGARARATTSRVPTPPSPPRSARDRSCWDQLGGSAERRVLGVEVLELLVGGLRVGDQHEHRHHERADRQHGEAAGPRPSQRSDRTPAGEQPDDAARHAEDRDEPLARPRSDVGNSSGP